MGWYYYYKAVPNAFKKANMDHKAPVPGEAVRATLPGPQLYAARGRSTCRRAPRPPEARGSRLSTRPPASQAARTAVRSAYSTLHFAEGADAQRVAQHVVSDFHPPVVLLLLSHLLRARPRSAPAAPRRRRCRRLPTVQRALRAEGADPEPRGARGGAGSREGALGASAPGGKQRASGGRGRAEGGRARRPLPGVRGSRGRARGSDGGGRARGAGRECGRGCARCTGSE
ncbi:hypothetical protein H8959_006370 [Pygathrix nigripes]